jgi:alpha-glucosidase
MYQDALELRRRYDLAFENPQWIDVGADTLAFRSGAVTVVVNFGAAPVALPEGEIVLASGVLDGRTLPTDTTVWLV